MSVLNAIAAKQKHHRQRRAACERNARELPGMLAGDLEAHFARQIVVVHMGTLEQAHPPDRSQTGRGFRR